MKIKSKGFTLIEVMIVIAIITIIAVIIFPKIHNIEIKQKDLQTEEVQKEKPAPIQNNAEEESGKSL